MSGATGRPTAFPRFLAALEQDVPLPPAARVLLAVSGGNDSLALLALFARLRSERRPDLELWVGHVQHGLRGAEAERAAALCRSLAAELGLGHRERRVDVLARRRLTGESEELAARTLRHAVLERWARELDLHAVALAHHADDQIETVLAHMLRGTGVAGLRGMQPSRPLRAGATGALETTAAEEAAEDGTDERRPGPAPAAPAHPHAGAPARLIRPLLGIPRASLEQVVVARGWVPVEDRTNRDPRHRRNRLRHELLPLIEARHAPQVRRALLRLAEEASQLEALRRRHIDELLAGLRCGPQAAALPRPHAALDATLAAALLEELWRAAGGRRALHRDHHRVFRGLLEAGPRGRRCMLPGGWQLERAARWLHLYRPGSSAASLEVDAGGLGCRVEAWGLEASWCQADGRDALGQASCSVDNAAPGNFRAARRGDRITLGSGGRGRVSELLRAAGLPAALRRNYPVLVAMPDPDRPDPDSSDPGHSEVLWIPGIRSAVRDDDHPAGGRLRLEPTASAEAFLLATVLGG